MPRISIHRSKNRLGVDLLHLSLEITCAKRSTPLKFIIHIGVHEKAILYINSRWRNDLLLSFDISHPPFSNRKITDLYTLSELSFFFFLISPLDVVQTSRHTRHCTLSIARARSLSLAYIVCYNVDSCITVVFGSLLAVWIIAGGMCGVNVMDEVLRTGFGEACN